MATVLRRSTSLLARRRKAFSEETVLSEEEMVDEDFSIASRREGAKVPERVAEYVRACAEEQKRSNAAVTMPKRRMLRSINGG